MTLPDIRAIIVELRPIEGNQLRLPTRRRSESMSTIDDDEVRRTSPMALWRYAHDYLRAAQSLCRQHRLADSETQAPYHLAAQGLEFALKAYLCARGATMATLSDEVGHSLLQALKQSEAQGLPRLASHQRAA